MKVDLTPEEVNWLERFRRYTGVSRGKGGAKPKPEAAAKTEVVPLERKLLRPRSRIRGREVEATEVREYHDPSTGWRRKERPHRAYGGGGGGSVPLSTLRSAR